MPDASPSIGTMSRSLVQIIADNAEAARQAAGAPSFRSLAAKAGLAPNTVRAVFKPAERAPSQRGDVSPRMDVVEKLAEAMGYQAWQLMQEGFEPQDPPTRVLNKREADFYRRIEDAYRGLDKGRFDGNSH